MKITVFAATLMAGFLTLVIDLAVPSDALAKDKDGDAILQRKSEKARELPASLQNVAVALRAMGRDDVANRMIKDYKNEKINIAPITDNAYTGPFLIIPLVTKQHNNVMTLNQNNLKIQADNIGPLARARGKVVTHGTLGLALTVIHEYVHMNQVNPTQDPVFEDKAWQATIAENQNWMRRVMSQITEAETKMPNGTEKIALIKSLTATLNDLEQVQIGTINGLKDEIKAKHVSAGQSWPALGLGTVSLDQIVKNTGDGVAAFNKNTLDGIARFEKELATGKAEKTIDPVITEPKTAASRLLAEANRTDKPVIDKAPENEVKNPKSTAAGILAETDRMDKAAVERVVAQDKKLAQDKAARERSLKRKEDQEKERVAKEEADQAKAEEKKALMAKNSRKGVMTQTDTAPQVPSGLHEEVSGYAKDKNGTTRLTYLKDGAGNIVGGYTTWFDPNGNELRTERFTGTGPVDGKTSADAVPSNPPGPRQASKDCVIDWGVGTPSGCGPKGRPPVAKQAAPSGQPPPAVQTAPAIDWGKVNRDILHSAGGFDPQH